MRYRTKEISTTVNDPVHRGQTVYKVEDTVKEELSLSSYRTKERAEEICARKNIHYTNKN